MARAITPEAPGVVSGCLSANGATWAAVREGSGATTSTDLVASASNAIGYYTVDRSLLHFDLSGVSSACSAVLRLASAGLEELPHARRVRVDLVADYGSLSGSWDLSASVIRPLALLDGQDWQAGREVIVPLDSSDLAGGAVCIWLREEDHDAADAAPGAFESHGLAFAGPGDQSGPVLEVVEGHYRLYRGLGPLAAVDLSSPVATVPADAESVTLTGAGHAPGARYTYLLRPVRDDVETPDLSCSMDLEVDESGDWAADRPAPVTAVTAKPLAHGAVRLRWGYLTSSSWSAPADFAVFAESRPIADLSGEPAAVISYVQDGPQQIEFAPALEAGNTVHLAVVARSAGGVMSRPLRLGPVVLDAAPPASPSILVSIA